MCAIEQMKKKNEATPRRKSRILRRAKTSATPVAGWSCSLFRRDLLTTPIIGREWADVSRRSTPANLRAGHGLAISEETDSSVRNPDRRWVQTDRPWVKAG